jgi:hypothetical protein
MEKVFITTIMDQNILVSLWMGIAMDKEYYSLSWTFLKSQTFL